MWKISLVSRGSSGGAAAVPPPRSPHPQCADEETPPPPPGVCPRFIKKIMRLKLTPGGVLDIGVGATLADLTPAPAAGSREPPPTLANLDSGQPTRGAKTFL